MKRLGIFDGIVRRFAHNLVRVFQVTLLAGFIACQWSCHSGSPEAKTVSPKNPFRGIAFRSLDELGQAAVEAIADSNYNELDVLRVADFEYRDIIWTRIPPTELANMDVETAWSWVDRDCQKAMRRILLDYGGNKLTFRKTEVSKEVRTYPFIRVIYGVRIIADDLDGKEHNIKLMNVVAEINGYYRVIAFDV